MSAITRWSLPPCMVALALLLGWWWRQDGALSLQQPLARLPVQAVNELRVAGAGASATFARSGDAWKQVEQIGRAHV